MGHFEVLVVEAVLHEVDKVGNDRLSAFRLQQVYQVVVGSRKEFYKDLANHAHARFFDIQDLNVVEIRDDVAAELFEFPAGRIALGYELLNDADPFAVYGVGRAGNRLVGAHPVHAFHEDVAEYRGVCDAHRQREGDLESRVGLQAA